MSNDVQDDKTYLPINRCTGEVRNIDLTEDLADVLIHMVVGSPLVDHPEVQRVLARYRQSKGLKP